MNDYRAIALAMGLSLTSAFGSGCGVSKAPNVSSIPAAAKLLNAKPDEVFRADSYFLTNATYQNIREIAALYKDASANIYGDECQVSHPAGPFDTKYLQMAVQYVVRDFVPKGSNIITHAQSQKAKDIICRQKAAKK